MRLDFHSERINVKEVHVAVPKASEAHGADARFSDRNNGDIAGAAPHV